MIKQAIVLAGGFGTRLQKVVQDTPKPMAPINGRPFLEYQLNYLRQQGINKIVFSVGYLSEQIQNYFGDKFNGIDIKYAVEKLPLGTGGAIKYAFDFITDKEALVVNGDTLFEISLPDFYQKHSAKNSNFSLALRTVDELSRYGSVSIDDENKIIKFAEKGCSHGKGFINGGVYIIHKRFFENFQFPLKFSLEVDVFEHYYTKTAFYGFAYKNYFLDIGIPQDYNIAQNDFAKLNY